MNHVICIELKPVGAWNWAWITAVFVIQAAAWFSLGVLYGPVIVAALQ